MVYSRSMRASSRRTFLSALAVAAVGGAALRRSSAEAGACAGPRQAFIGVVPSASDVIPLGEGVLVQLVAVTERSLGPAGVVEDGASGASAFAIGARLERARQRPISLRTEILGPGLARLVPTRAPSAGVWRVVSSGGQAVEAQFGAEPATPVGAGPEPVRIQRHVRTSAGPASGGSSTWITASLQAPLGPPWVGTITYVQDPGGAEIASLARSLDSPGASDVHLYTTPGRCAFRTPGQEPPGAGRDVRIAAYDLWGRVSARSASVRVTGQ